MDMVIKNMDSAKAAMLLLDIVRPQDCGERFIQPAGINNFMRRSLELMAVSVTSPFLKGKDLLIYSKCLPMEYPEVFEEEAKGKTALSVCMSEEHLDKVGFKIATIIAYARPSSIAVVTMDGSPHCTQLHVVAEQAKRIAQADVRMKHLVVERGALIEASSQAVYLSRHLSKIEELLRTAKKNL